MPYVDPDTGIEFKEDPEGVISRTPSGLEVYYQWKPKRLYELRHVESDGSVDSVHDGWTRVPSVTTVLDVLHAPALTWWGQSIGIQGILTLIERGRITTEDLATMVANPTEFDVERLSNLLTAEKLTVNHVRDKAGERGQSAHDLFERWARTGAIPDERIVPLAEQGYTLGVKKFLADSGLVPDDAEVMVGSLEHLFAGRYDLRAHFEKDARVVARRMDSGRLHYTEIPAGTTVLGDLKTSKHVYEKHFIQLEAYEGAGVEDGYEPTDARAVLHVFPDGGYEFVRSDARFENFLGILAAHQAMEEVKGWKTRMKKG